MADNVKARTEIYEISTNHHSENLSEEPGDPEQGQASSEWGMVQDLRWQRVPYLMTMDRAAF
ncbi:hypothetical protein M378DRAFT_160400 [Amanita muscaria Koide BX008]|uniref:Uncharacterized protein n=1 Tax=Amanita muscaria (strain Koide BX008) TaxID=946122 RepID=A0A0C2XDE9_AMAMK|nr:hypothetical protein M378DRAFT_160400 [Amanita muscaria Koide BX008]